jgi:hypothetical protein
MCVKHVLHVLDTTPTDSAVDTVETMQSVVSELGKLGKLESCAAPAAPAAPAGGTTAEAQACDATRLIVDMINFAIDNQTSNAKGGSFGARRTRAREPRRFL